MLPKIKFKYSYVYDKNMQACFNRCGKKSEENVSFVKMQSYIERIEKVWRKNEKNILGELSRITNLKWKEKEIICYVVNNCKPFSDPLTISFYNDRNHFIDVLTHELIHQILTQNYKKIEKALRYIDIKYNNESEITKIHILLYAVHSYIYKKLFNNQRLNNDISRINFNNDYKKSWEIVKKDGYKNIIKEFVSKI